MSASPTDDHTVYFLIASPFFSSSFATFSRSYCSFFFWDCHQHSVIRVSFVTTIASYPWLSGFVSFNFMSNIFLFIFYLVRLVSLVIFITRRKQNAWCRQGSSENRQLLDSLWIKKYQKKVLGTSVHLQHVVSFRTWAFLKISMREQVHKIVFKIEFFFHFS